MALYITGKRRERERLKICYAGQNSTLMNSKFIKKNWLPNLELSCFLSFDCFFVGLCVLMEEREREGEIGIFKKMVNFYFFSLSFILSDRKC